MSEQPDVIRQASGSGVPIFLDLDGVLLDVSDRYYQAHIDALRPWGVPRVDASAYWQLKRSRTPTAAILQASEVAAESDEYLRRWVERVEAEDLLARDRVFPGAAETLQRLSNRHPLLLVTLRQYPERVRQQLAQLDLLGFFAEVLVGTPTTGASWDVKRDLIRSSPFFASNALVVGDTEVDIRAGKALGLRTIAVLSGIRDEITLAGEAPWKLVPCLAEVEAVIPIPQQALA
jgi:phosphoglycolate phosphatase